MVFALDLATMVLLRPYCTSLVTSDVSKTINTKTAQN